MGSRSERRFALALFLPALLVLVLTTTFPLGSLLWTASWRIDLAMPWNTGFAGAGNFLKMVDDPRVSSSLRLTVVYSATTVVLQVAIGLALALLVNRIPRGQAV